MELKDAIKDARIKFLTDMDSNLNRCKKVIQNALVKAISEGHNEVKINTSSLPGYFACSLLIKQWLSANSCSIGETHDQRDGDFVTVTNNAL